MPPTAAHLARPALSTLAPRLAFSLAPGLALGLALAILTGCQSLGSTMSLARVRVIDISPDAPAVDIYQDSNALAYNLSFGTVTSYISIAPGSSTLTIDMAGSKQVLSSAKGSFTAGAQYTVLMGSSVASLQQLVLQDQAQQPASAAPSVRLVHQAVRTGAVDVYLVPAGHRLSSVKPLVTGLLPGANTAYLAVPAGVFTAVMLPAGTMPSAYGAAAYTASQSTYANGSARTLILLDPQSTSPLNTQIMTAMDAEPAS